MGSSVAPGVHSQALFPLCLPVGYRDDGADVCCIIADATSWVRVHPMDLRPVDAHSHSISEIQDEQMTDSLHHLSARGFRLNGLC